MDLVVLLQVITQIGLGAAAWRLATKIDKRQVEHERTDLQFQKEVRQHLGMREIIH